MILRPGDCLRLYAGTKDDRPGVVMSLTSAGAYVVLTGTKTDRTAVKPPPVVVTFPSWEADEMGLTKTTWFTTRGVEIVSRDAAARVVQRYKGRCPPAVFLALGKLIGM